MIFDIRFRSLDVRKVHDALGVFLVALVLIAPLPMGSNRPIPWMMFATLLSVVLMGYMAAMLWVAPSRSLRIAAHSRVLALGLLMPIAALLQTLPIAQFLPRDWLGLPLPSSFSPETISLVPQATYLGALRQLSYAALFVLVIEVAGCRSRIRWMLRSLFAGVTAHGLWALLSLTILGDSFFWGPKTAYLGSATGTFINRNSFATFMGMGLVLGVCVIFYGGVSMRGKSGRNISLFRPGSIGILVQCLWLLAVLLALFATQSRMGIAASLVAALGCFAAFRGKALAGWCVAALVVLVVVLANWQGVLGRSIFLWKDSETRIELYRQVLGMIRERPVSGYGLDAFPPAFELFHQRSLGSEMIWDYAHSSYLTLWVEVGLIVGSLPVLVLVCVAFRLRHAARGSETDFARSVMAIGVIALAGIHSLVDFSLEIEANVFLFVTLVALGLSRPSPIPSQAAFRRPDGLTFQS